MVHKNFKFEIIVFDFKFLKFFMKIIHFSRDDFKLFLYLIVIFGITNLTFLCLEYY